MKVSQENKRKLRGRLPRGDAAKAILDVAEKLAQTRGYNGFSYADIAVELGVTKASLHYHFPSKEALGRALIERYETEFGAALEAIDRSASSPQEKLGRYVELYDSVARNDRMCLCGMLAADVATLPNPMRESVAIFFAENEAWLTRVLSQGTKSGELQFAGTPAAMAGFIVSSLEGAMLVARGRGGPAPQHDPIAHRRKLAAASGLVLQSSSGRGFKLAALHPHPVEVVEPDDDARRLEVALRCPWIEGPCPCLIPSEPVQPHPA